ncbi:MAG: membrane protein insertase YidC, partial [Chitinophagaceae bacterium]
MKFEKNSVIGFVLLAGLFMGYFYFTRVGQLELEAKQKQIRDSLAALQPIINDTAVAAVGGETAVVLPQGTPGSFVQEGKIQEELTVLENELVRISFSNKGARPVAVELKNYVSEDSQQVKLISGNFNQFSYLVNTGVNQTTSTEDLYFSPSEVVKNPAGEMSLVYSLKDSTGRMLEHRYMLKANEYMFGLNIVSEGADKLFTNNTVNFLWQLQADQQELDIQTEKRETQLGLYGADGFDYFTMSDGLNEQWDEGVKWLGVKQKFF